MYNCKNRIIKITSAEIVTGTLLLQTGLTEKTIRNGGRSTICICTDLPTSTTVIPVEIVINGTNIPMQDVLGNTLQSDQITSRCAFPGVWGTQPLHFKLCNCLKRSLATAQELKPGAASTAF